MIQELFRAFILIFIAEMGDKTQILAMAFATRFPVKKVLAGIFIGALLNHGLAVILGNYISNFIPVNTIQIVAGFAFVGFSLWTLKSNNDDAEEEEKRSRFGPVVTVALAFFIGELGDKTQLTAITLATDASYPLLILCGTVLGMIVTGGIGIIIGKKLGDKIPEFAIKIIAASVFMFFGITKLYQTLPDKYLSLINISLFIGVIGFLVYILLRSMIIRRRQGQESLFRKKSREIYDYYHHVEESMERVCLGADVCGECRGNKCIVGYTKALIKNGLVDNEYFKYERSGISEETLQKHYNREEALEALRMTLDLLKKDPGSDEYENIHEIRKSLEMILFGGCILKMDDWIEYQKCLKGFDETAAGRVLRDIDL